MIMSNRINLPLRYSGIALCIILMTACGEEKIASLTEEAGKVNNTIAENVKKHSTILIRVDVKENIILLLSEDGGKELDRIQVKSGAIAIPGNELILKSSSEYKVIGNIVLPEGGGTTIYFPYSG